MIGFEIPKIKPLKIEDLDQIRFREGNKTFSIPNPEEAMVKAIVKQQETPVQGFTALSIEDGPIKKPSHVNINEKFLITQVTRYINLAHEIVKENSDQISWINRSAKSLDIAKMIQQETLFGNGLEH